MMEGYLMAANAALPNRKELIAHLRRHHWTTAEAKAFAHRHAELIGSLSYDDWEDLSREYAEANA